MKKKLKLITGCVTALLLSATSQAQISNVLNSGEIHGNFQTDIQYYNEDSLIGAPPVPEKMLMNGFANLIYTNRNFNAGVRYESYMNALQGFPVGYKGNGIPYRYAGYSVEGLEITVGNYYEQFGNGMIFRTYEERGLGYDNAMDGIRLKYSPIKAVYLKGIIGRQRLFFDYGPGIVRGIDGEIILNELSEKWLEKKTKVVIGGSFVSKYQQDQDPVYNLPENVGAYGGRLQVSRGKISVMGEYAYKINDPSSVNKYIYKHGEALFISTGYSQKGLGITLAAKRIDNMNFRSDRNETINNLNINYLPALTKQHTYNLAATLYPYATQPNGEIGLQGDIIYTFKKDSRLGGKYGTTLSFNYSSAYNIDTVQLNDLDPTDFSSRRLGYSSDFFKIGEEVYFSDFNVELNKKISSKVKAVFMYMNLIYNMEVIQGLGGKGIVYADVAVADIAYKINTKNTIRTELQSLTTKQDQGNWGTGIIEYTYSPSWFVAVMDQYNYGNKIPEKQIHYVTGSVGYMKKANRFTLSYGRQRAGIFCVGGVCRNVPASNGLTFSITSSF